ncbi:amino acid permease [Candidatus Zixiibacteriota bacterium]
MTEKHLHKHLNLKATFSLSIGPMLSSGIFLLPALVFSEIGPAAILVYLIAGLLLIPSLLSQAELATAMPRAGGTYYFLDRSLGALVGTVAGAGTWLALTFKSAFDLIGLGAYLVLFLSLPVKPVAVALCVLFAGLSISGMKKVAQVQVFLVSIVLAMTVYFIAMGLLQIDPEPFTPFITGSSVSFLGAIGLVYIGFTGLTKVASVAEEIDDLERTIPLAMIYALAITTLLYILVMIVLVGVLDPVTLSTTYVPMADAARKFLGPTGTTLISITAITAFIASANAGLTAASRYPFAMARDDLAPAPFRQLGRFHTPTNAIIVTALFMIPFILILSPTSIAKLASAFQLMLFGMLNLAVIVMRESRIESYDPGFRARPYPWIQIIGILTSLILIPALGMLPVIASTVIVVLTLLWYILYAKKRVSRSSALLHVFERMGRGASHHLDIELRQILREKGLRKQDMFENSIIRADILHHYPGEAFDGLLAKASVALAGRTGIPEMKILDALRVSNRLGETPIGNHIALPHARVEGVTAHELAVIHSKDGLKIEGAEELVHALLVLIGPTTDPGQHLRFLAELANRAEGIDFAGDWRNAENDADIKEFFLRSGEVVEVELINPLLNGLMIRDLELHPDCLIAMIIRGGEMIVPHGQTCLVTGDMITLVGEVLAVGEMAARFTPSTSRH